MPKIIQVLLTTILTLFVCQFAQVNEGALYCIALLTVAFVVSLRSPYLPVAIIVSISTFSLHQRDFSLEENMEIRGRIVKGPIFYPEGCSYHIQSKKLLWKVYSSECQAGPGDLIETYIHIHDVKKRSGRAVDFILVEKSSPSLQHEVDSQRQIWFQKLQGLENPGLTIALTTGNKSFLSPRMIDVFRDIGISHLLAISGLHFGLIAGFFWVIIGFLVGLFPDLILRFGKSRIVGPFVILGLYLFLIFVGSPLSAQRAFVMIAAYIFASIFFRHIRPVLAMLYALCGLVLYDPTNLWKLGFQLSFCAVFGIICVLNNRKWFGEDNTSATKLKTFVAISVAAGLSTMPVLLVHTGQISIISYPINLIVVPLFSVLLFPLVLFGSLLFRFSGTELMGKYLLETTTQLVEKSVDLGSYLSFLPGARLIPGSISPLWGVLLFVIICFLLFNISRLKLITLSVLSLTIVLIIVFSTPSFTPQVHLHFIDVGQGDSIFIRTPDSKNILIDTGGSAFGSDPGQRVVAPYLKRLGVDKLDIIVITHDDIDHKGGLKAVLRTLPHSLIIKKLSGTRELKEAGFRVLQLKDSTASKNDRSLILVKEFGESCFVLTGDIEKEAEAELGNEIGQCDILKLPHHGSKTSSTSRFLDAIDPVLAIVSAGKKNRFGHPHPSVLSRLKERHIDVLSTQEGGSIYIELFKDGSFIVKKRN